MTPPSTQFRNPSAPLPSTGDREGQPRHTMTSIIQRELEDFGQRQPRRSRVVGRLLFLQVALLLMGAPLTVWPAFQPIALAVTGLGLILFLFAWIRNISGAADQAQRILVGTSALVTALNMAGQVFWHPGQVLPVGLASFPFLLTIFTAGLLFEPEVVLLTSICTTATSAVIFFIDLFLMKTPDIGDASIYLLAVTSLGLQALCGMMAWQIAQFIKDYSAELEQARREEFIATQLDALRRSVDEQAMRLREQVGTISGALVSLSTRNYATRVGIIDGDLKPIADAFNLLAQQLGSFVESEHATVNVVDDLTRLMDLAAQMTEGGWAGMPPLANMPMSASAMSNLLRTVNVTLQRAQQSIQQRFDHIRELAIQSGNQLTKTAEQTYTVETSISSTLATIGLLRSKADHVLGSAEHMNQLIDQCLTELSALLPPEVSAHAHIEVRKPSQAMPELQQVLPGVTIQLDAIDDDTELGPDDVAPTTPAPAAAPFPAETVGMNLDAQAHLREVWSLITQMTEEVAKQVRDAQVLEEQLGVSSRSLRQVDNEVNAMRQMILQTRQVAEQQYMTVTATRPSGPLLSRSEPSAPLPTPIPPSGPRTPSSSLPPTINAADLLLPDDSSGDAPRE